MIICNNVIILKIKTIHNFVCCPVRLWLENDHFILELQSRDNITWYIDVLKFVCIVSTVIALYTNETWILHVLHMLCLHYLPYHAYNKRWFTAFTKNIKRGFFYKNLLINKPFYQKTAKTWGNGLTWSFFRFKSDSIWHPRWPS